MFNEALFTVVKTWKQQKFLSTYNWIKMCSLDTMEYYPAIRTGEILSFVTTWMDLENIMLSKISQSEKAKNHIISLICGI